MNTTTITKQNKKELGLNRNEFYEYKKNRAAELAKKGATVAEIAKDLGMEEKEMYAFLSRNFGGVRHMRKMKDTGTMPQLKMASMDIKKDVKAKASSDKPVTILSAFNNALSVEKDKLLTDFKSDIQSDAQRLIEEIRVGLKQVKDEMLSAFKNDIMRELSELAKAL